MVMCVSPKYADLEVDTFKKSNMSSLNWIKSSDDNFLVVNSEGQLLFEDLNKQQRCNSGKLSNLKGLFNGRCFFVFAITLSITLYDYLLINTAFLSQSSSVSFLECKFTIYPYNSSQPVDGMAVMLVAIKGNEKKVVCCSQEGEIHAETLVSVHKVKKAYFGLCQFPIKVFS